MTVVSSAFSCGDSSKRIVPPPLPVRAFGAEVNYLLALVHHVSRANVAAAAALGEHPPLADLDANHRHALDDIPSHFTSHNSLQADHTCAILHGEAPTSIYRGGWFLPPPSITTGTSPPSPSEASLVPLDFWYTVRNVAPGHGFPASTLHPSQPGVSSGGGSSTSRDELGLMGYKQAIASFLLRPSRRLELLTRAAAASIGLQVLQPTGCAVTRHIPPAFPLSPVHLCNVTSGSMPRRACASRRRVCAQPQGPERPTSLPGTPPPSTLVVDAFCFKRSLCSKCAHFGLLTTCSPAVE
jgi:hypothetical protein